MDDKNELTDKLVDIDENLDMTTLIKENFMLDYSNIVADSHKWHVCDKCNIVVLKNIL